MAYLSITDFGAVADGRDNRAAIQAAIDAAKAQGKDVFVPAGTFLHNGVITLNGVDMIGSGSSSVLKAVGSDQQSIRLTGDGAAIKNITLDSDATTRGTQNNNAKINVDGATNFTVDGVTILNANSAGMMIYGASNGTITNNIVKNTKADSIHITGGSNNVTVSNNRVENSGDDGIAVVSYGTANVAHDIIVSNNTILNNAWGRNVSVVGGYNVQIANNYISGNGAGLAGVYLATEPAYDTAGVQNVQVTGNTILNTGSTRTGHGNIMLYDGTAQTISGITISSNFIVGMDIRQNGSGIQATITNNQINTGVAAPAVPSLPVYGGTVPTSPPALPPSVSQPPSSDGASAVVSVYANGDQFDGAPQFQLLLNGQPYGTAQSVTASRSSGAWQKIAISLPLGADPDQIGVRFINDAGGVGGDRNLYVDRIELLGTSIAAGNSGSLYRNGETATFNVSSVRFPAAPEGTGNLPVLPPVTLPPPASPPAISPPAVTSPPTTDVPNGLDPASSPVVILTPGPVITSPPSVPNQQRGSDNDDVLLGQAGNDTLVGGGGNDSGAGGDGDDRLGGNQGADTLMGGQGRDEIYGGRDNDWVEGNVGNDTLLGDLGNDTVHGGRDDDQVLGGQGYDQLSGDLGNDRLWGGRGFDTLNGGAGDDTLSGDRGDDQLSGGAGADRFLFTADGGNDTIVDFSFADGDRLVIGDRLVASFDAGSSGEALIRLTDGGSIQLSGITAGAATTEWIVAG